MRVRKKEDQWMPPRVYRNKVRGKYVSFVYRQSDSSKTITLCTITSTKAEVWVAYESIVNDLNKTYTIQVMSSEYLTSGTFQELAPRTQRDRQKELDKFNLVFGKMVPDKVEPHHVRKYMDKRGVNSKTQANHELASASVLFGWGYERGKCKTNPCKGIKKFKLKARDRYITDMEYDALISCAEDRLIIAMEISYLCAARQGDVLSLSWSQISDDGIYIKQGKTGKKQIKAWSDRLLSVVNSAKKLQGKLASIYVINKKGGGRLTEGGLRSSWIRAVEKMKTEFPTLNTDFTFHDIKAKSISDFDGTLAEKQQFSGHKTLAQVNTYDRKVAVVPSLKRK